MGIDVHALSFLVYAKNLKKFQKTVTIGRQGIHTIEPTVRNIVGAKKEYRNSIYCEDLLIEYFGSTEVESIDSNSYENASIIHDMNVVIADELQNKFDTVIDCGCSEHIYNVAEALKNYSYMCKPGGQIIHILPANNFCGHGFWQFSPELFFSLYSKKNGYDDTEVFIADLSDTKYWYKVKEPISGKRANVSSSNALYLLVRTKLRDTLFDHSNVQQSDYVYQWNNTNIRKDTNVAIKAMVKKSVILYNIFRRFNDLFLKFCTGLNRFNPWLTKIKINSLL